MRGKIFIAGSEGSLMQECIPLLLARGYVILGVDKERKGSMNYSFIPGDLRDKNFVNIVLGNFQPDYIIQAAATIYGVAFNDHGSEILSNDIALHSNLLEAAKNIHITKFIYLSSSMVYEQIKNEITLSEDMELPCPKTGYGLSKFLGEKMCMMYGKDYDIPMLIWRPFNIITPKEIGRGEIGTSHVFADFIKSIIKENMKVLPIIGDGKQIRCFTWIGDVAQCIVSNSFGIETGIFNIGDPRDPVSMKELATRIYKKSSHYSPFVPLSFKTVKEYENDVRIRIPNVSKIKDVFGWEPYQLNNLDYAIDMCVNS